MTPQQIYDATVPELKDRLTYLPITSVKTNRFVANERKRITVELSYRQTETEFPDAMRDDVCYGGFGDFIIDEPSEYERLNSTWSL